VSDIFLPLDFADLFVLVESLVVDSSALTAQRLVMFAGDGHRWHLHNICADCGNGGVYFGCCKSLTLIILQFLFHFLEGVMQCVHGDLNITWLIFCC